jgi:glycosyltransferase involved in cell wall biosynthesis
MAELLRLTPDTLEFVLLSFEGPDQYAMAGGLGVRMKELALELARQGFRTHLVFIGDPDLPPQESPMERLTLHRWGQWLSAHYRGGVYQGEEAKLVDWNEQLPGYVVSRLVKPAVAGGRLTAVLAEEWHTAYSTCQLSDRLWAEGLRDKAVLLWNANNVMGFDRINWGRLDFCSQITTVSRYMKHVMWDRGVNPLVIPNGIPGDRVERADPELVARLRAAFPGRELVFKIGRFSPDKRWNMAMDAMVEEKRAGQDIATVVRGGVEPHGMEVLARARARGLQIVDVRPPRDPVEAIEALAQTRRADVYNITSFMSDELISVFYTGSDAVLANSGHEPFGLVGLEVMAAGGITFVGTTGEDYAVPFLNCIAVDTDDPTEINIGLDFLRRHPDIVERMRCDAMETAQSFSWKNVVEDNLLGKLRYVSLRQLVTPPGKSTASAAKAGAGAAAASRTGDEAENAAAIVAADQANASAAQVPTAAAAKRAANRPEPDEAETPTAARESRAARPDGGDSADGVSAGSGAAGGGTVAVGGDPAASRADSAPYGGESLSRRPSIKPQTSES